MRWVSVVPAEFVIAASTAETRVAVPVIGNVTSRAKARRPAWSMSLVRIERRG